MIGDRGRTGIGRSPLRREQDQQETISGRQPEEAEVGRRPWDSGAEQGAHQEAEVVAGDLEPACPCGSGRADQRVVDHFEGIASARRPTLASAAGPLSAPPPAALLRPLAEYEAAAGGGWS